MWRWRGLFGNEIPVSLTLAWFSCEQKKIRENQLAQYNYILVVGKDEMDSKTVISHPPTHPRTRGLPPLKKSSFWACLLWPSTMNEKEVKIVSPDP